MMTSMEKRRSDATRDENRNFLRLGGVPSGQIRFRGVAGFLLQFETSASRSGRIHSADCRGAPMSDQKDLQSAVAQREGKSG